MCFQQAVRQHFTSCVLRRKPTFLWQYTVCNRWYFTFDGAECTKPATIEGVVYVSYQINLYRPGHIEGYCNEVPKGHIRVAFWIGKCQIEWWSRRC